MSDEVFDELAGAMVESSLPFMEMIGRNLTELWNFEDNPSGFPSWVNESVTPLVITYDYDEFSWTRFENDYGYGPEFNFIVPGDSAVPYDPLLECTTMGIQLGVPKRTRPEPPLVRAMYLAKEYISLITTIPATDTTGAVLSANGYKFEDYTTHQPLTGDALTSAGRGVFMHGTSNSSGLTTILHDGFATALLARQVYPLIDSGELPGNTTELQIFATATNILYSDPQNTIAEAKLRGYIDFWVTSGEMLPPDNYLDYLYDPDISRFIREFQAVVLPK